MSAHIPEQMIWINSLAELAEALGATAQFEADLLGSTVETVLAEREAWFKSGRPSARFLRKWRALNAVNIATHQRLTGHTHTVSQRILEQLCRPMAEVEPLTGKAVFTVTFMLLQGFTIEEMQRAREGQLVYLTHDWSNRPDGEV